MPPFANPAGDDPNSELAADPATATEPEPERRAGETPMIEADHLSKFYGIFAATRDVSFKVYKGEVVAFLGPNGAGKSTTMKILTGYLSASEGRARIAGYDMATATAGRIEETWLIYPKPVPSTRK